MTITVYHYLWNWAKRQDGPHHWQSWLTTLTQDPHPQPLLAVCLPLSHPPLMWRHGNVMNYGLQDTKGCKRDALKVTPLHALTYLICLSVIHRAITPSRGYEETSLAPSRYVKAGREKDGRSLVLDVNCWINPFTAYLSVLFIWNNKTSSLLKPLFLCL